LSSRAVPIMDARDDNPRYIFPAII
jgi:hypothetical protein